jgi:hypothetical protein
MRLSRLVRPIIEFSAQQKSMGQPLYGEIWLESRSLKVIGRGVLQIKNTFSSVAGVLQIGRFLGSE